MIYPIDFTSRAPQTETLTLLRRQSGTESPWTLKQQTVHTASQWSLEWTWPQMTFANAEKVMAWITSLRGMEGSFLYQPRQRLTSTLVGRSVQTTAFAYNRSLIAQGWAANAASELRAGQFLQVGSQLVRLVEAPLLADANGRVTISFEPELRINYSAGTAINFTDPAGKFRLSSSDAVGYTLTPDKLPTFPTMTAKEAV